MYLCGEQRCAVNLHDAWQQHSTQQRCAVNLHDAWQQHSTQQRCAVYLHDAWQQHSTQQRCAMKLHDAWQQQCTPFWKLNFHSNRHIHWPVHPCSSSCSILKLGGTSINDMHNTAICCVYVNLYVTFCYFSGTSHPCEAPFTFALSLRLSACMFLITGGQRVFDIGGLCDEVFELFQFTLNWMVLMPTLHAHTQLRPCCVHIYHSCFMLL